MATTYLNPQAEAHGKRIWAKAELGVAEALTKSRIEKGFDKEVLGVIPNDTTTEHVGSRFYTTDQLSTYHWYDKCPWFNHPEVKARMKDDNMKRDIDLWCASVYKVTHSDGKFSFRTKGLKHSISVKSQTRALTSYNISLELETYSDDGRTRLGWFETSHADFYSFVIGHKFVMVNKAKLKEMVEAGCYRTVSRLTNAAKATNVGRTFNDAKNLLVPVADVAKIGYVMDMPEWYITAFKHHNKVQAYKDSIEFWNKLGYTD